MYLMKEIKFSFDEDNGKKDSKEAEVIDLSEYREYIKEFFAEKTDDDDEDDSIDEELISDEDSIDDTDESKETDSGLSEEYDDEYDDEYEDRKLTDKKIRKTQKKRTGNVQKNKKGIAVKVVGVAAAIAAVSVVFLASPIFAVKNIEINELQYFTKEDICSRIGLYEGDNGVFFNKGKAEKTLKSDKYISDADLSFRFPDTMVVTINENRICGYIHYLDNYLYLDREGRVIDVKKETSESLPIIEGLEFSSFTVGEIMNVENEEAFESALIISKAMSKYEILDKNVSINVADSENIYAYVDNIKVLLGDTTRMEEKIKTMSEAIAEIPDGDMGTLDLQDLSQPIIFKYST